MSTRSKTQKTTKTSPPKVKKRVENSWLMFAKEILLKSDELTVVSLPHPSSGDISKYCIDGISNKIYEIITFEEDYRSWFIGESVKSDGKILLTTPINWSFLVLPLLRKECLDRAIPLEDLLTGNYAKLLKCAGPLDHIADLKGPSDVKAYKYNEEKTLKWLKEKVHKVSAVLKKKNIHVTSGAVSATFVTSLKDDTTVDDEFYLKYAFDIVSDYLTQDLSEKLKQGFNFNPELVENLAMKRKSESNESSNNKKVKIEIKEEQKENQYFDSSINEKVKKQNSSITTKQKNLQKAASGSKTISSFFSKK